MLLCSCHLPLGGALGSLQDGYGLRAGSDGGSGTGTDGDVTGQQALQPDEIRLPLPPPEAGLSPIPAAPDTAT